MLTFGLVVDVHRFAIDEQLPFMLNIFLAQSFGLLGTLTVISYATSGVFLLAVPPLAWAYVRLQRTYRATSREIKRIDAVTRSPLYVHHPSRLCVRPAWFALLTHSCSRGRGVCPVQIFYVR